MNTAMKLLLSLGVKMEQADDGTQGGGGDTGSSDFQPTEIVQQSNIFDDQQRQQSEDDEETNLDDNLSTGSDDDSDDEPNEQETKKEGEESEETTEEDSEEAELGADEFMLDGVAVTVENDPQLTAQLKEAGFDIHELNKEIYSTTGLTADTKIALYDKFGRAPVDMYLKSLERHNSSVLAEHKANEVTFASAQRSMADTATGGQFKDVMKWANDNLNPTQYERYRAIINSDNLEAASFALENLTNSFKAANPQSAEQTRINPRKIGIDTTETVNRSGGDTGLSAAEYNHLFTPTSEFPEGEYFTDPNKFDGLRALGRKQGL